MPGGWIYQGAYDSPQNDLIALRVSSQNGRIKIGVYHANFYTDFIQNSDVALEIVPVLPVEILDAGLHNFYATDRKLLEILESNKVPESDAIWSGLRTGGSDPIVVPMERDRMNELVEEIIEGMEVSLRSRPLRKGNADSQEYNTWVSHFWHNDSGINLELTLPPENPEGYIRDEIPSRIGSRIQRLQN